MNRAYFIILVPALLVLMGYMLVFRMIGVSLPYPVLIVPAALVAAVAGWMLKRSAKKTSTSAK